MTAILLAGNAVAWIALVKSRWLEFGQQVGLSCGHAALGDIGSY